MTKLLLCSLCSGKGYTLRKTGDIIACEVHNFGEAMRFCQCQRGGELELLVEGEKGKAFEKGQYSVRGEQ